MDDYEEEIPDLIEIDENTTSSMEPQTISQTIAEDTVSDTESTITDAIPQEKTKLERQVIPLTILTGWLGSGKTTLLHNLLEQVSSQGKTIAILQNETSELMGVERALRLQDDSGVFGEILEVKNGCVCCSVKSDFLLAIDTLLQRRHFDHVVVECSGVADVGALATRLWVDDDLASKVFLDGIVCIVDAQNVYKHMGWSRPKLDGAGDEVGDMADDDNNDKLSTGQSSKRGSKHARVLMSQLIYADRIIVNKCDILSKSGKPQNSESEIPNLSPLLTFAPALPTTALTSHACRVLQHLQQQLRAVNALAPIIATTHSRVPLSWVLNLKSLRLGSHSVGAVALRQETTDGLSPLPASQQAHNGHNSSSNPHVNGAVGDEPRETRVDTAAVVGADLSTCAGTVSGVDVYTRDPVLLEQLRNLLAAQADVARQCDANKSSGECGGCIGTCSRDACSSESAKGEACAHDHSHACESAAAHSDSCGHMHGLGKSDIVQENLTIPDGQPLSVEAVTNAHGIGTVVLRMDACVSLSKVREWLVLMSWEAEQERSVATWQELRERQRRGEVAVDDRDEQEEEGDSNDDMYIYRMKGVLAIEDVKEKYYLQGVLETFDLAPADQTVGIDVLAESTDLLDYDGVRLQQTARRQNPHDIWQEGEGRHSAIIFIGYKLNLTKLIDGFSKCRVDE